MSCCNSNCGCSMPSYNMCCNPYPYNMGGVQKSNGLDGCNLILILILLCSCSGGNSCCDDSCGCDCDSGFGGNWLILILLLCCGGFGSRC